ncbi:MAG: Nif3-like dinuclear metal center hexameric protein [Aristaeellaceae bacterium]
MKPMLTVQHVYDFIDSRAPFALQESFDNAGLLVGDPGWEVRGIHVAMDVTSRVLDEAQARGANLIITHHPMMFSPRKRMTETDAEGRLLCRMIRGRMALIAAHTNLDRAPGGINDVLAAVMGLTDVTGEDFVRVGRLPAPMTAHAFAQEVSRQLGSVVRVMGSGDATIQQVGLCSGAGSDFWPEAAAMGAQAFLTGEAKHHHALAAAEAGVVMLEAGHFATEAPGIFALADALQIWPDAVQYDVCVSKSEASAYA